MTRFLRSYLGYFAAKTEKHVLRKYSYRITLEMGGSVKTTDENNGQPKKLKACCACPETKKARDACIMENGEENCKSLIDAHKECMRKMGFNI